MAEPVPYYGVATPEQLAGKSGLAMLEAMLAGALPAPPMAEVLGFRLIEVADGVAVFAGEPSARLLNPLGTVHGGWALTLIDSATGCAAHSTLPPGFGFTSIETKANFTRPITPQSGTVRCAGRVIQRGRRIILTEASMTDTTGRLLAHGTSTCMVLEMPAN